MTTPGTASNSDARKRLAEQNGSHTKHWDPAVVQLIEQARAEGAAEVVARVERLVDEWQGSVDAIAITYQDPLARRAATSGMRNVIRRVRAALRGDA